MTKEIITLGGFMDLDRLEVTQLKQQAKEYGVVVCPMYYESWELLGEAEAIEKITLAMWNMPRDQWGENLLHEEKL